MDRRIKNYFDDNDDQQPRDIPEVPGSYLDMTRVFMRDLIGEVPIRRIVLLGARGARVVIDLPRS